LTPKLYTLYPKVVLRPFSNTAVALFGTRALMPSLARYRETLHPQPTNSEPNALNLKPWRLIFLLFRTINYEP